MRGNYLKDELYSLMNSDENIFEFIQLGSLDGIWYWDLEHPELEWMSPKFWETLGYNPNEKKHLSSEWQDIIFEDDLELAKSNLAKHCLNPNHPYDQIVRYKHKNGSTVWIRCRGIAIRDKHDKAIRLLGAHTDITELKKSEQEISRLNEEYSTVFNGTQNAMFLVKVISNSEFRYIRNNIAHQNKTGISLNEIKGQTPVQLFGNDIGDFVTRTYQKCCLNNKPITIEDNIASINKNNIWLTTLTPIIEYNKTTYIVGSSTDITKIKQLESKLEQQANYDKLTGLPNRRLFFTKLNQILSDNKLNNEKFAILFIDLDGFKNINDKHGHKIGDEVLVTIGKRLSNIIAPSDIVARMGGDEFTIMLRNISDTKSLTNLIKQIHSLLKEIIHIDSIKCNLNSSIGVAIYPHHGNDIDTLIKNADSSMYEIKKNGKGGFKFCEGAV